MELREQTVTHDDDIRALVARLSRPDGAGGHVIERAAILAAGSDAMAVLDWIAAHDGRPEMPVAAAAGGGLHGGRMGGGGPAEPVPLRYVLPSAALG